MGNLNGMTKRALTVLLDDDRYSRVVSRHVAASNTVDDLQERLKDYCEIVVGDYFEDLDEFTQELVEGAFTQIKWRQMATYLFTEASTNV